MTTTTTTVTRTIGFISLVGLLGLAACASSDGAPVGAESDAGGGSGGEGGAVASGGSTGSGGATATGGATGTGGSTATGGSTGTGGAVATGGSTGTGMGTVTGMVRGNSTFTVSRAYWIGMPGGMPTVISSPVSIFILESPLSCADISKPLWDKTIGAKQVLELNLNDVSARTYPVPGVGIANYVAGTYNPSASGGSITVTALTATKNIVGNFDVTFPGGDGLKGSFDAPYCPTGVEP